jgi:hypothetical protein
MPEIQVATIRRAIGPITHLILINSERNAHVGHPGKRIVQNAPRHTEWESLSQEGLANGEMSDIGQRSG